MRSDGGSRLCFCIAGWAFDEAVYARLREAGADLFAVCHHLPPEAAGRLGRYLPQERILRRPNLGYDWGCYQQFLQRGEWRRYEAVFFLHDDLEIYSLDFIPHALELLQAGAAVVGNGLNHPATAWPRTHTQCYAHSRWLPPSLDFEHQTVRGSFFAASAPALERVEAFEVFWDPRRIQIRFGNHSQIATCGKFQQGCGEGCFAFLGQEYRRSPYLLEQERGGRKRPRPTAKQRLATNLYNRAGRAYVRGRMQSVRSGPGSPNPAALRRLGRLLAYFDGVDRAGFDLYET